MVSKKCSCCASVSTSFTCLPCLRTIAVNSVSNDFGCTHPSILGKMLIIASIGIKLLNITIETPILSVKNASISLYSSSVYKLFSVFPFIAMLCITSGALAGLSASTTSNTNCWVSVIISFSLSLILKSEGQRICIVPNKYDGLSNPLPLISHNHVSFFFFWAKVGAAKAIRRRLKIILLIYFINGQYFFFSNVKINSVTILHKSSTILLLIKIFLIFFFVSVLCKK